MAHVLSLSRGGPFACCKRTYRQYSVITGISMVDTSEAVAVNTFIVLMLAALAYFLVMFSPNFVTGLTRSI